MVIKSKESKISKYSKLVDKYLNVVYELQNDIDDLEVNYIMELLEDIQSWRGCLDEMEYNIKSHKKLSSNDELMVYDKENKNIIIY